MLTPKEILTKLAAELLPETPTIAALARECKCPYPTMINYTKGTTAFKFDCLGAKGIQARWPQVQFTDEHGLITGYTIKKGEQNA